MHTVVPRFCEDMRKKTLMPEDSPSSTTLYPQKTRSLTEGKSAGPLGATRLLKSYAKLLASCVFLRVKSFSSYLLIFLGIKL